MSHIDQPIAALALGTFALELRIPLEIDRQSSSRTGGTLGQRGLAKQAGVSLRQVSSIITGKAKPTPATLAKLLSVVKSLEPKVRQENR
jgi:predicted transcriptional regulator